MSDSNSLIKANPLLPAEDYDAQRKAGIAAIAQTGSDIWTDYNFSDPGITMLEAVTYAITDLAYRTGWDIKDLLAPENLTADTWKQIFYTARQILHNSPLTIDDYRKLIIDVPGVRNAWVTPSKDYEVPIWIDFNAWEHRKDLDCGCQPPKTKLCLGQLRLDPVDGAAYKKAWDDKKAELSADIADPIHPNPQKPAPNPAKPGTLTLLNMEIKKLKKAIHDYEKTNRGEQLPIDKMESDIHDLKEKLKLTPEDPDLNKKLTGLRADLLKAQGDLASKRSSFNKLKEQLAGLEKSHKAEMEQMIEELKLVSRTPKNSEIVELEGLYNIMVEYEENVMDDDQREAIRQKVIERLAANRNLCEDVLSVDPVEYEDFGIGASFVVQEYADTDAILAEVFFRIFIYFTPSVPFYTVQQMLDKGYQVDEIFEGPALDHGFIDNVELERTDLFRDLHLSDLINELSEIPGIVAVTYLHLPFHGFRQDSDRLYFNRWIEFLKQQRKVARIQPSMSQVFFCKEREVITYYTGSAKDRRPDRMLKLFKDLKTMERRYKLEGVQLDFPVPAGENMNLEDYYPVTYSLPLCYGVSDRGGLPGNADSKRKIQALQLKGYLLFFEQLLSDYLVQLDHLRDLFSFDDTVTHTYFTRALGELDGIKDLLIDQKNRGAGHFDQILNDFSLVLQELVEPVTTFHRRRNRFLDHMLARFSEDLGEYENICRWLVPDKVDERLIADKIRILKDGEYIHISSERGLGYNYAVPGTWDVPNISGTERRVSRLLGFSQIECRTLAPDFIVVEPVMDNTDKTKPPVQKKDPRGRLLNIIKLLDPDDPNIILLTSVEVPDGCCTDLLLEQILEHADDRRYYISQEMLQRKTRKAVGLIGTFSFDLFDDIDPDVAAKLASTGQFDSRDKAEQTLKRIFEVMAIINDNEGLHLVEHILLRPKLDIELDEAGKTIDVKFLDICMDKCDLEPEDESGVEYQPFRIKVTRIPPDKCYDQMPWVLNYLRATTPGGAIDHPFLFQQVAKDNTTRELKFRQYTQLAQRIKDLREYGTERVNYAILDNGATDPTKLKYGFVIKQGPNGNVLAQSLFEYNKRPPKSQTPVTDDVEELIQSLMRYFAFELDLYCDVDPCDNNEDPYSFRATVVLPCWPKRLRDHTFRNLVEKTIQTESPAHVQVRVVWVGIAEMQRFETAYSAWLKEMSQTEIPGYEKVNPLVDVLNTIKPCGTCEEECK